MPTYGLPDVAGNAVLALAAFAPVGVLVGGMLLAAWLVAWFLDRLRGGSGRLSVSGGGRGFKASVRGGRAAHVAVPLAFGAKENRAMVKSVYGNAVAPRLKAYQAERATATAAVREARQKEIASKSTWIG